MLSCMILPLLLAQDPVPDRDALYRFLEDAQASRAYLSSDPKFVDALRRLGVRSAADLLPFAEPWAGSTNRHHVFSNALRGMTHYLPVDKQVQGKLQELLPRIRGDGEQHAVTILLKSTDDPTETASSILPDVGIAGLYTILSWAEKTDQPRSLVVPCLERAHVVVREEYVGPWLSVLSRMASQPRRLLTSDPEYTQPVLELFLEAAAYPENMDRLSRAGTYGFLLTTAQKTDPEAVADRLEELVREGPDPLPALVAWQIFRYGVESTEVGSRTLEILDEVRPDLRPIVDKFRNAQFNTQNGWTADEEVQKLTGKLVRDDVRALGIARRKARAATQPASSPQGIAPEQR